MAREKPTPLTPTAVVAAKVLELRKSYGWSAEQLATRMRALGIDWTRMVVTKLETGRRQSVSIEELLALGYALDCAPVDLMIPWDDDAPCWVATGIPAYPSLQVRRWARGWPQSAGLPGSDPKRYVANTPPSEDNVVYVPGDEYQKLMQGQPSQRAVATYEEIREQEEGHRNG